jgi:hypothetical protein
VIATAIGAGLGAGAVIMVVAAAVAVMERTPTENLKVEPSGQKPQRTARVVAPVELPAGADGAAAGNQNPREIWPFNNKAHGPTVGDPSPPVPFVTTNSDAALAPRNEPALGPAVRPTVPTPSEVSTRAAEDVSDAGIAAPPKPREVADPPKPKRKAARHSRHERKFARRATQAQTQTEERDATDRERRPPVGAIPARRDADDEEFSARESYAPEAAEAKPQTRNRRTADRIERGKRASTAPADEEHSVREWRESPEYGRRREFGGFFFVDGPRQE